MQEFKYPVLIVFSSVLHFFSNVIVELSILACLVYSLGNLHTIHDIKIITLQVTRCAFAQVKRAFECHSCIPFGYSLSI